MRNWILYIAAGAIMIAGCKSMNKQQKGTVLGASGGAVLGALFTKGSVWGIIAGAAIGGAAGNMIGKKMDAQAKELKQAVPTAQVERVSEGIEITFESAFMFKLNSAEISDSSKADLASAVDVFKKYADTKIIIEGHTDDTGSDEYNMTLSAKRANAVKDFFVAKGISADRLSATGYGETKPKYANDSEANRQKNRRVELAVIANDKMQQEAKEGKLQ